MSDIFKDVCLASPHAAQTLKSNSLAVAVSRACLIAANIILILITWKSLYVHRLNLSLFNHKFSLASVLLSDGQLTEFYLEWSLKLMQMCVI